eukprot:3058807-Pyramimonas_sp.AAC.1
MEMSAAVLAVAAVGVIHVANRVEPLLGPLSPNDCRSQYPSRSHAQVPLGGIWICVDHGRDRLNP